MTKTLTLTVGKLGNHWLFHIVSKFPTGLVLATFRTIINGP